jgi:hypothetical protein
LSVSTNCQHMAWTSWRICIASVYVRALGPLAASNGLAPTSCRMHAQRHWLDCTQPPGAFLRIPTGWQPKVNTALWNTIQLLFPQHAAEAPPPTPPGQPAAAPQAAGSSAGAARMTEQEQQDYQAQLEVSRGRRAGRGSLYHMASAVAASQGHRDAAVRQPFRPPR